MNRHAAAFILACCTAALPAQALTWWDKGLEEALVAANDVPAKLVMLYCWEDKHETCSAMFSGTMSDERVQKELGDFVCKGIQNDDAGKAAWTKYRVQRVPTVLFLAPSGEVVDAVLGYATNEQLLGDLQRIRTGTDTIPELRKALDAGTAELPKMLLLMQKLRQIDRADEATQVIDAMIAKDPRCKTEQAAEAMLWRISKQSLAADIAPKDYDLTELRRFLKTQRNKRIKFLGYDRMAAAELRREDLKAACAAAEKAWKSIPEDEVIGWGQNIATIAYRRWKDLNAANKAFLKKALKISKATLKAIEKRHQQEPDKTFLGNAMYLHAAVLLVNGKRKDALSLMDQAMEIDPKNESLPAAKANWVKGNK
ncbi:MAG: hypothetical protein AB8H80_23600 [Planctomycetota bacterium]